MIILSSHLKFSCVRSLFRNLNYTYTGQKKKGPGGCVYGGYRNTPDKRTAVTPPAGGIQQQVKYKLKEPALKMAIWLLGDLWAPAAFRRV